MKMTRLEWRYLQKIALDHPYFDTHELPLTEKEAKAIVEANNRMTGKEFVDSIYAKLGMTRSKEEKKRFAWLRNIGELFTVPPIRKIAIAVLIIVLMTVFFAATPAGRAIAESMIHYIATLFDDGSLAVSRSDNEALLIQIDNEGYLDDDEEDISDDTMDRVSLNTIEDFIKATGKDPFILPLPYTELCYEYDPMIDYLVLYVTYKTSVGEIVAYQIWNIEDMVTTTATGYTEYDEDATIYYSIEETGNIAVRKVFEDSYLGLVSKGYALNDLAEMLKNE